MSKELTVDEVRRRLIEHVRNLIDYWDGTSVPTRAKLEGVAFSILVALDGSAAALPAFIVAPLPHPEDKQHAIDNEEDYYPENDPASVRCDIGGTLHEVLC